MCMLILSFAFTSNTGAASAPAPAPEYFVINDIEKKCGIYWSGDEFSHIELPEGWTIYDKPIVFFKLDTPFGSCTLQQNGTREIRASDCCLNLNMTYIKFQNVSYYREDVYENGSCGKVYSKEGNYDNPDCGKLMGPYKCTPTRSTLEGGVIINPKTKECTDLFTFYLSPNGGYAAENQCYITDSNFRVFTGWYENQLITPHGECYNFSVLDYSDCCNKLGLEDVGRNLSYENTKEEVIIKENLWQKFFNWLKRLFGMS